LTAHDTTPLKTIHTRLPQGHDYLTELDQHAAELSSRPQDWMPWNYRQTLASSTTPAAALT